MLPEVAELILVPFTHADVGAAPREHPSRPAHAPAGPVQERGRGRQAQGYGPAGRTRVRGQVPARGPRGHRLRRPSPRSHSSRAL